MTCNKVVIGNATLYCGDCAEIAPTLGRFDLLLTDPPYGIGEAAGKNKSRNNLTHATDYGSDNWDDAPPDAEVLSRLRGLCANQIIFGGNYFDLPPSSCWLVWDKDNGASDFADCELAWTNLQKAVRRLKYRWNGMLQENMARKEAREHPTQKPVPVMRWCLSQAGAAQTVFDPFMGSGTTGVACHQMGKTFTGIEREPKYFDIACRRIEDSQRQMDMFPIAGEAA